MDNRVIVYMNDLDDYIYRPFSDFECIKIINYLDTIGVILKLKNDLESVGIYLSKEHERKDSKYVDENLFNYNRDLVFEVLNEALSQDKVINLAIITDVIEDEIRRYKETRIVK